MAYYDFPGTVVVIMVEKPPQENQEVLEPQAQQGNGVGNQNERLEIVVAYPPQVDPKGLDPELIERVQVLEQKTNGFADVKRVQVLEEQTKQFADIQKVQDLEEQTKQFADIRRVQILEEQTKQFATAEDLKVQTKQFATIKNLEEQTKQFATVKDLEAQTSRFATVARVVELEKTTTRYGEVEAVEAVKKELREVVYQFCQCLFPSTAGIIGGLWLSMPCGYGGILAVILVSLVIFLLGAISCYKMWVTYTDYQRRNEGIDFWQWWGIAWPYVAHLVLIVVAATVLAAMIGAKAYNHQCITPNEPPEPLTPNSQPDLQGFVKDM